jgi:hypothetical protein
MEKEMTPADITALKLKTLRALKNEPSRYKITVIDNSMLPDKLKERKTLEFVVKPPTIHVLTKLAIVVETVPESATAATGITKEVLEYIPVLSEMLAIMIHGNSKKEMDPWLIPFLEKNLTTQESLMLWQETALKIDTSFFLPFIQTAKAWNPMSLLSTQERESLRDSTPTQ